MSVVWSSSPAVLRYDHLSVNVIPEAIFAFASGARDEMTNSRQSKNRLILYRIYNNYIDT